MLFDDLARLHLWLQGSGTQVTREMETQVLITALALPYGGKILFAATETGVVRCYKYPLTGGAAHQLLAVAEYLGSTCCCLTAAAARAAPCISSVRL